MSKTKRVTRESCAKLRQQSSDVRTFVVFGFDILMVSDDLTNHEAQELFREIGVKAGGSGQGAQALNLASLAVRVSGRQIQTCFDVANALRTAETLGENVNESGIDVIDRCSSLRQLGGHTAYRAVG